MSFCLGADIGGTNIKVGLVDEAGRIVARRRLRTDPQAPPGTVLERLARTALAMAEKHEVAGFGIGIAGLVDHRYGIVYTSPNLPGWERVPVKDTLARLCRLPVFCANDANAVALGEWLFGAARGSANALVITLGTGVGTGIIAEGRLLLGANHYAGELGHTVIFPNGVPCPCGNRGCLERYVGAEAIVNRGRRLLRLQQRRLASGRNQLTLFGGASEQQSLLFDLINYDYRRLTPKEIGIAARKGDRLALQVVEETGRLLGLGIYNALMILDPEIIVLGGGISRLGSPLLRAVRKSVNSRLYGTNRRFRIVLSKLVDDAGILGASRLGQIFPAPN
ncbi:MAG: ROK family protein [candidate division WOR-3 bacterium]